MSTQATGVVRIKTVPQGEAPENIRAAWIDLTLPCYPTAGYIAGEELGVRSGLKEKRMARQCVVVPRAEALTILRAADPDAAEWWDTHAIPGGYLCFGLDEVEIIHGVRVLPVVVVTEEMYGDPYR